MHSSFILHLPLNCNDSRLCRSHDLVSERCRFLLNLHKYILLCPMEDVTCNTMFFQRLTNEAIAEN